MFHIILVIGLLMGARSFAHDAMHLSDWIRNDSLRDPQSGESCCGENDCKMLPANEVTLTYSGYYIRSTGEVVPTSRVLWRSKDGAWWRCAPLQWDGSRPKTRCLIGPPQSY